LPLYQSYSSFNKKINIYKQLYRYDFDREELYTSIVFAWKKKSYISSRFNCQSVYFTFMYLIRKKKASRLLITRECGANYLFTITHFYTLVLIVASHIIISLSPFILFYPYYLYFAIDWITHKKMRMWMMSIFNAGTQKSNSLASRGQFLVYLVPGGNYVLV
jgi:hypothetical protein